MGRPTKCTPKVIATITRVVGNNGTYELAAKAAGVTYESMRQWMLRGATGDEPYLGFLVALQKAEADAAERCLARIDTAARKGNWTADAWLLERRHGYTKTERREVDLSGTIDTGADELRAAIAALREDDGLRDEWREAQADQPETA